MINVDASLETINPVHEVKQKIKIWVSLESLS